MTTFYESENYFDGYNESIDKLKNNPEAISFEQLIWHVFSTKDGQMFFDEVKNRILIPSLLEANAPNYRDLCVYTEGYKQAFRMLLALYHSHEQRIKSENNNTEKG